MLKNLLIAAAILIASPALVFADNIFFAFENGAAATDSSMATTADGSGSVYLYSDGLFAFDAAELYFESSNPNVVQVTGGEGFNPTYDIIGGTRFAQAANGGTQIEVPAGGNNTPPTADGRYFAVNVTQNGIDPQRSDFDPDFESDVILSGANGAFLLGRVDFDIIGTGTTNFDLTLGANGVIELLPGGGELVLDPTLGSATLTVTGSQAIPEPSSLALLILGSVGMVARRRRA